MDTTTIHYQLANEDLLGVLKVIYKFLDCQNFRKTCLTFVKECKEFGWHIGPQSSCRDAETSYKPLPQKQEGIKAAFLNESYFLHSGLLLVPPQETTSNTCSSCSCNISSCYNAPPPEEPPQTYRIESHRGDHLPSSLRKCVCSRCQFLQSKNATDRCKGDHANSTRSNLTNLNRSNRMRRGSEQEDEDPPQEYDNLKGEFNRLKDEHQKLMLVTSQLLSVMQVNLPEQPPSVATALDQCKDSYPHLFPKDHPTNLVASDLAKLKNPPIKSESNLRDYCTFLVPKSDPAFERDSQASSSLGGSPRGAGISAHGSKPGSAIQLQQPTQAQFYLPQQPSSSQQYYAPPPQVVPVLMSQVQPAACAAYCPNQNKPAAPKGSTDPAKNECCCPPNADAMGGCVGMSCGGTCGQYGQVDMCTLLQQQVLRAEQNTTQGQSQNGQQCAKSCPGNGDAEKKKKKGCCKVFNKKKTTEEEEVTPDIGCACDQEEFRLEPDHTKYDTSLSSLEANNRAAEELESPVRDTILESVPPTVSQQSSVRRCNSKKLLSRHASATSSLRQYEPATIAYATDPSEDTYLQSSLKDPYKPAGSRRSSKIKLISPTDAYLQQHPQQGGVGGQYAVPPLTEHGLCGFDLDYGQIKSDLLSKDTNTKLSLLQALRWRMTQTCQELRDLSVGAYINQDILGLRGEDNIAETFYEDMNSPVQVRKCYYSASQQSIPYGQNKRPQQMSPSPYVQNSRTQQIPSISSVRNTRSKQISFTGKEPAQSRSRSRKPSEVQVIHFCDSLETKATNTENNGLNLLQERFFSGTSQQRDRYRPYQERQDSSSYQDQRNSRVVSREGADFDDHKGDIYGGSSTSRNHEREETDYGDHKAYRAGQERDGTSTSATYQDKRRSKNVTEGEGEDFNDHNEMNRPYEKRRGGPLDYHEQRRSRNHAKREADFDDHGSHEARLGGSANNQDQRASRNRAKDEDAEFEGRNSYEERQGGSSSYQEQGTSRNHTREEEADFDDSQDNGSELSLAASHGHSHSDNNAVFEGDYKDKQKAYTATSEEDLTERFSESADHKLYSPEHSLESILTTSPSREDTKNGERYHVKKKVSFSDEITECSDDCSRQIRQVNLDYDTDLSDSDDDSDDGDSTDSDYFSNFKERKSTYRSSRKFMENSGGWSDDNRYL